VMVQLHGDQQPKYFPSVVVPGSLDWHTPV
jgi:hypothetical protein